MSSFPPRAYDPRSSIHGKVRDSRASRQGCFISKLFNTVYCSEGTLAPSILDFFPLFHPTAIKQE